MRWCLERGVAIVPGVATPTEMERAMGLGLTHLKFFPAETLGGTSALKAFAAPYGALRPYCASYSLWLCSLWLCSPWLCSLWLCSLWSYAPWLYSLGALRFMPTGGVTRASMRSYLALPCVLCPLCSALCVGG